LSQEDNYTISLLNILKGKVNELDKAVEVLISG